MKIKIEPDKYYSAKATVDLGVLPWKNRMTFNKVLNQKHWAKILNPVIDRKDKLTRYYIKGSNIIKFLELWKKRQINQK